MALLEDILGEAWLSHQACFAETCLKWTYVPTQEPRGMAFSLIFFLASYLACNLPDIYSTSLSVIFLAIYLRFCLASYLTYYPGQCSGQAGPRDSASWRYCSKKRRQTRAYIKSRDPHLAGGERQIHRASLGPTPMNFCQETLLLSNGRSNICHI